MASSSIAIPLANDPKEFLSNQYSTRNYPKPTFPHRERTITGAGKPVRSIAWSCDGKRVATGLETRSLRVWEVRESIDSSSSFSLPSSSSKPSPHNGNIAALAFSPTDPHILVSGCRLAASGGVLAVWDVSKPREPIATFSVAGSGDVISLAFHPSGRQFAAVCNRNRRDELAFYHLVEDDSGSGKEIWVQRNDIALGGPGSEVGADEINSFSFGNSGKYVSCVSNDGSLTAWAFPIHPRIQAQVVEETVLEEESAPSRIPTPRENTPEPTEETQAKEADVKQNEGEDVDMDEGKVESGDVTGDGGEANQEDAMAAHTQAGDTAEEALPEGASAPTSSAEDAKAADPPVGAGDKDVEMAEPSAPAITVNSSAPSRQPSLPPPKAASDEEKTEIAQNRAKQLVRLRKIYCSSHTTSLLALAFDPLGRYLAVGGLDGMLALYDTQEWISQRSFPHSTSGLKMVAFSNDGEMLAAACNDNSGAVYIMSVATGELLAKYDIAGMVLTMAWHPKKNWLAWSVFNKTAQPTWFLVKQD